MQEIAYAISNAIAVLDAVRERVDESLMGEVFGRISFFVNAGVRFIEEHAKLRAMSQLWDELGRNVTTCAKSATAASATAYRSTRSG